ncbi:hypothetical protein HG536_0C03340 [Torulaspora globosa]|uniref:Zn(2)-C6 fungal-type domain-containing protein n=1 Tax=Torulaspora globosa TaxID=48254 RepID=A0A7G3ZF79_9SACH|nr:uncharacterized protein HG536_0C03340 [Torulaspora globosa]QLL32165.1 hypothetical protein HG536_0C03340 [Torulaspora globosa]
MFSRPGPRIDEIDKEIDSAFTSPNSLSPFPSDSSSQASFLRAEKLFSSKNSGPVGSLSYSNGGSGFEHYASMTSPTSSNEKVGEEDGGVNAVSMPQTPVTSTVKDCNGNVKRKYSRNGCTECKRRRIKCDETKPTCWQCARLNRECVYVLNLKNKKRKNREKASGAKTSEKEAIIKQKLRTLATPKDTAEDMQLLELPNVIPAGHMDGYDANLLIQNLNDIVSMKLNDSLLDNADLKNLELPNWDIPELMPSSRSSASPLPISFLVHNVITFNTKLSSFKLGGVHDDYLGVFFNDCLDSIAPFFQGQENPLRDIILSFARNESYLLSATLAVGASIAYRKSNSFDDEKNYCGYLSHCLSLLGEQFQNESNVLNKIEPITLTVIMLAWDCINTMNSQWRSHLKGVTDLFKKINSGNSSKVMNVAKCWFKVMETFASISTVLGGSVTDDDDLDLIFNPFDYQYVDSLRFLNIMTPLNKFNLLRGHQEDFDLVIKEVIKALTSIRKSEKYYLTKEEDIFTKNLDYLLWSPQTDPDKSTEPVSYFNTQKILVQIDQQLDYQFIDKSGIIPPDSQSHPNNSNIQDNAIDLVTLRSGETIAISWYDISHQTQVLSFLLIVLLKLLGIPKESITIQQVVKKILGFFKFLDSDSPPANSRTCYSNFAVLIAGLNAMDEETRNIVRSYYKLNGGRFQRLTEHNLNRLEKVWYGKDSKYRMSDQDVLTW